MAIKTKEELLAGMKNIMGDNVTDEALSMLDDISDTYDNLSVKNGVDWEKKYRENDTEWRKKYRERFFGGEDTETDEEIEEENEREKYRYEKLFKEG